jgi:hypothetical protein
VYAGECVDPVASVLRLGLSVNGCSLARHERDDREYNRDG